MKNEQSKIDAVEHLLWRAKVTDTSDNSLKFSQAALNSANALRVLADVEQLQEEIQPIDDNT